MRPLTHSTNSSSDRELAASASITSAVSSWLPSGCTKEAVRDAIDHHIEARRKDEKFQARLSKLIEDNQRVLDRLAQ